MDIRELKIRAADAGYRLVPVDAIRTATASANLSKLALSRMTEKQQSEMVIRDLSIQLAALIARGIPISQLPHELQIEYRMDVTVIQEPVMPTSESYLLHYKPFDEKKW